MTQTPPVRPALRRRTPLRLRVGAGLAAVVLAVCALPAAAAVPDSAPAARAPIEKAPTFVMAPASHGVLSETAPLAVTFQATNPTSSTLSAGRVTISLGENALDTDEKLSEWLAAGDAPGALDALTSVPVDSIASRGVHRENTIIPVADSALDGLAPGVYPLRAAYRTDAGELTADSTVVVERADANRAPVAIIVPITAGPLTDAVLSADELTEMTAPGGELAELLDAVAGTEAVLAIDPAIAASIRLLGDAAPSSARTWLDTLLTLPNSRFALQYGDADIAVQLAAGLTQLQQPTDLSSLAVMGSPLPEAPATPDAEPSATPSATPSEDAADDEAATDEPEIPTLEELLDIGSARDNIFWPATGTADASVVAGLHTISPSSVILISSSATTSEAAAPVAGRAVTGAGADVILYDSAMSRWLREASSTNEPVTRASALASATAYAALASAEPTARALAVTVDRADARSRAALRESINAAQQLPGFAAAPLDDILRTPSLTAEITAKVTPAKDRVAAVTAFGDDEALLSRFATILDDPAVLTGPERASILQLLGNAWLDQPAAWTQAVSAHYAATQTTLDSVAIVPPLPLTLAGSSAPLPFTIRNDLPWPVSVELIAAPADPRLVVERTTEVNAAAEQNTRAGVPVQARVGSGDSIVNLHLRSATGVPIGEPVAAEIAVRAEWESVGLTIMAVIVGVLLVLGIVRTVIRIRRRSAAVPSEEESPYV